MCVSRLPGVTGAPVQAFSRLSGVPVCELDEILGNATDLPITEHATDTHGVTLVNFALFDLVGLQLSPRIRDLGKITLYRTGANANFVRAYRNAGPLLTRRLDTGHIWTI
jgi:hypothetical protein